MYLPYAVAEEEAGFFVFETVAYQIYNAFKKIPTKLNLWDSKMEFLLMT